MIFTIFSYNMKKLIIFIFTISLSLTNIVYALNMKSLNDFFKIHQISDPVAQIYAFQRCSALYAIVSQYAPDDRKVIIAVTAASFGGKAQSIYSKTNNKSSSESEKKIMNEIIKIQKFYEEDSNEIYLKENSKFAGYISLDLEFCYELEKVLN
jgi:hypothetical protein